MGISDGLGAMLASEGDKGAGYLPYVGKAYKAYKAFKGFKDEGVKGVIKSVVPFSSSFGSKGSKTNKIAQQYQEMVNKFDAEYLQPTMSGLNDLKRDVSRSTRIGSQSFRSVMASLTGAKQSLDDLVGSSNFGGISSRIKEITDLVDDVGKVFGKGSGPGRGTSGERGALKLPRPELNTQVPTDRLPSRELGFGKSFAPIKSEGHRFAVKTTRTPDLRI